MSIITLENLTKTFGRGSGAVHALRSVSIEVREGEIFSLLGPNGAGKTTIIKCLLGIIFPTEGHGSLFGYPLGAIPAKEHLGYLPENHRYPLHLTGDQVLQYFGKLSGLEGAKLGRRITTSLELVGMSDWGATKVRKYSKGMMQRLGLAQAMLNDPQLIILDEPTDGVDPVGRKEIRDILLRLRNEGKTVFLNSHLLSEVERISDRVVILRNGEKITEGTVQDLTETANVYTIQVSEASAPLLANTTLPIRPGSPDRRFDLPVPGVTELNECIDKMRAANIEIESIAAKKSSLEDLFIDLMTEGKVKKH